MNCFSETDLVQKPPTLTVNYLEVGLRTFSSFKTCNSSRKPNNLTPEILLKLSKNKNVAIQKSDKGNSVVLIDKIVSTSGIKKLLDNSRQFEKLSIDPSKELNFILNCEQIVIGILKEIKNENQINEDLYNKLHPVGSQPGVLYCLTESP